MSMYGRDDDGLRYIGGDYATDLRDGESGVAWGTYAKGGVCVASPRLANGIVQPVGVTAAV